MTIEEIIEHSNKPDDNHFRIEGHSGVAFYFAGIETQQVMAFDDDEGLCEYEYDEIATGMVKMVMVGDDQVFVIDPDDLYPISDDEFCSSCGQIGCGHG